MGQVVDTCVWIDHLRPGTPERTRALADGVINDPDTLLCEPVRFELLAGVAKRQRSALIGFLETVPLIETPRTLWTDAAKMAAALLDAGVRVPPMDILVATICVRHGGVTLVTFDAHFAEVAKRSDLSVRVLTRPD